MGKKILISVLPVGPQYDWTLLAADVLARLKRLTQDEVIFYAPIPEESEFSQLFRISSDNFKHILHRASSVAQHIVTRLQQQGDVFKTNTQCRECPSCGKLALNQNTCQCGAAMGTVERDVYFFRASKYSNQVQAFCEGNIYPRFQQNDILNSLSKPTEDSVIAFGTSREKKVLQPTPWLHALAANLTLCGYPGDEGAMARIWSNAYLFFPRERGDYLGYWSAVLIGLGLPRPQAFVINSPLVMVDKDKKEVSTLLLAKNYGYEGLRYFLSGVKVAQGDVFTEEEVLQKINHDLANELGNLVSRVSSLIHRFSDGIVPPPDVLTRQTSDLGLREAALETPQRVESFIQSQEVFQAIKVLKSFIARTNRFIETTMPWQLAATQEHQPRLNTVLYNLCEALRFLAITLKPLLPEASESIIGQLGLEDKSRASWSSLNQWGLTQPGTRIDQRPPLFPRIVPGTAGYGPEPDLIIREELRRIHMVVARIVSVEKIAEYDGLLQMVLYDGRQRRRVLAPVARFYNPGELSGRKVIMVSNLKPVDVGDMTSEGEVLVTETENGRLLLAFADDDIPEGSRVLCLT